MTKAEKAASLAEKVAADNSHGYQWGGWGPQYDCGHLVCDVYEKAGIPVISKGGASYTGDMRRAFLTCGCKDVAGQVNLRTGEGLKTGDALVNEKNHAAIYVGGGKIVQARSDFDGVPGDSSGQEIRVQPYYNYPWDHVLRYMPAENSESSPVDAEKVELPEKKDDFLYHGHKYRVDINLLKYGNYGPQVLSLQQLLNAKGFGELEEDGVFGWNTKQAVIKLQEATGSRVDGEFGGESFTALWNMKEVRKK